MLALYTNVRNKQLHWHNDRHKITLIALLFFCRHQASWDVLCLGLPAPTLLSQLLSKCCFFHGHVYTRADAFESTIYASKHSLICINVRVVLWWMGVYPPCRCQALSISLTSPFCLSLSLSISLERGLNLSTPIISAGSFGTSCDNTLNLQRLLPPARKLSHFFIEFWKNKNTLKSQWKTAYVYKKPTNTEDCFWWVTYGVSLKTSQNIIIHLSKTTLKEHHTQ